MLFDMYFSTDKHVLYFTALEKSRILKLCSSQLIKSCEFPEFLLNFWKG